jgi:hypothetical protein
MQAYSLLLGHPWEHDNDATHHGRSNKYTFMHKGQKITLVPLTPAEIVQAELLVRTILNLKTSKLLILFSHLKRRSPHLIQRPRELN